MVLYLQKDYNGTFALAVKNQWKDDISNYDYLCVMDNINKDMTFQAIYQLAQEKFGCTKMILDF